MEYITEIKTFVEIELEKIFTNTQINLTNNFFEFENYLNNKVETLKKVQEEFLPLLNKYCEKIELSNEQHFEIQNFVVAKTQNLFNK
jgi:hypothetical protein